ncbi:adenosylcobinamide-GDP ribazoletransferase [Paracoccus limosus]|uniref:Adenosylcobinamide-GDP ribazoletransferase n=1 Tax=Paracoccus limosus TaxID=913252 RepID=A0A844H9A7_9RHOB|nr:adenosylcobinamide-GDP ribazoletransferase [Paracoccus limosus]MTH35197.1 adenosylcobinamide-GDP ribazoletransferase [Paracoccus limosus]
MAKPWTEAATAFLWLSRLPVAGLLARAPVPLARAAWAFPLVGLVLGGFAGLVLMLAAWLGLPPGVAALLAVAVLVLGTGALHEDGLADYCDGCGGATTVRALEIMRDSRIGSYGVLGLVLVTGLRVAAIASAAEAGSLYAATAVLAAAALSRAGMVAALRLMRPARPDGLGHGAGRPSGAGVLLAWGLGAACLLVPASLTPAPVAAVAAALATCAAAQLWLGWRANRRLGGQTGDVLGALQQLGETATLLALVALRPMLA